MRNRVVLFDFNNLLFRNFFIKEVNAHTVQPDYMLWRYNVYNSIYQSLWVNEGTTEVILAVDDRNSWRKSYFPRYKESRKKQRDKSDVNWDELFKQINNFVADLRHYMPFKIIKIKSAEADDVIAILSKGLTDSECIIISNDEDYKQLCCDRIKVYNPTKKEYLVCNDTKEFVQKLIFVGQKKDDIFNIITPDDWGQTEKTDGKRKPGFGEAAYRKVLNEGIDTWLEKPHINRAYGSIDVRKNFKRNRILIDFDYIPKTIQQRVAKAYENYSFPPPSNIYQFFKKYNMRGFLEDFTRVEAKLLELY